jgi:hypothetical protein
MTDRNLSGFNSCIKIDGEEFVFTSRFVEFAFNIDSGLIMQRLSEQMALSFGIQSKCLDCMENCEGVYNRSCMVNIRHMQDYIDLHNVYETLVFDGKLLRQDLITGYCNVSKVLREEFGGWVTKSMMDDIPNIDLSKVPKDRLKDKIKLYTLFS